jgi:hypothetical protein
LAIEEYMNKYESISNFKNLIYYDDSDIKICESDLTFIRPLNEMYSSELWFKFVSNNKNERHYMLLGNNHWAVNKNNLLYLWDDDWNKNDYLHFSKLMDNEIKFNEDDKIILFWMKERAVEITWSIFKKYWINFLFEDEGVIIINEKSNCAIILSNGYSWVVTRR